MRANDVAQHAKMTATKSTDRLQPVFKQMQAVFTIKDLNFSLGLHANSTTILTTILTTMVLKSDQKKSQLSFFNNEEKLQS